MEIESFRIRRINIPFKLAFKHSLNESKEVHSVILEIRLKTGEVGYGEAVPRSYVTGETVDSVIDELALVLPTLVGKKIDSVLDLSFPEIKGQCVRTCLELSLLDALGKQAGTNIINLLGGAKSPEIIYSGVISAGSSQVVEMMATRFHQIGMKQIKLKVGENFQTDLDHVALIQKIFGDDLELRVDANAAWRLHEAKDRLLQLANYGVVSCEQPMARTENYSELMAHVKGRIRISMDEGLCTLKDAESVVAREEADVFNLRVSKNGGLLSALKLHKMAQANGLHTQLGAQVGETSILSAAGRILALLAGDMLFHEGSFGLLLLESDVTDEPLQFGKNGVGSSDFLMNPGLGVVVNQAKLDALTVS